jgi:ABC-2 type transport system permease protein
VAEPAAISNVAPRARPRDALRPYLAVLSARFRMMLQYRAAAIAGIATQVFWGVVRVMVLEAFYRSATDVTSMPMNLHEVCGYIWLGQAFLAMLPWNVDLEIRQMVRSGAIAYELARPTDLYWLWFARSLAWRTAPTLLRAVPIFLLAMLVLPLIGLGEWRLGAPPSVLSALAWIACMIGAIALTSALSTLLNISLLWTIAGDGVVTLVTGLVVLLTGMVIPLPLFPAWAQPILRALPFAGIVDLPFRVYTGNIPASGAGWVLMHQLLWTAGLVLFGRWLLSRGMRRVVVQGG